MGREMQELIAAAWTSVARLRRATTELKQATEQSYQRRARLLREREARQADPDATPARYSSL